MLPGFLNCGGRGVAGRGKREFRGLNLHLKAGEEAPYLLRIYFYYDEDEKLIVVGSLPDYLPIPSYC